MKKRFRTLIVITAMALSLGALAVTSGQPAGASEGNGAVKIFRLAYYPNVLEDVLPGEAVRFNNIDGKNGVPHSATSDDGLFDTGVFYGSSRTITAPTEPGTYSYFCVIHPFMHGFLEVEPPDAPPAPPVPGDPSFTG